MPSVNPYFLPEHRLIAGPSGEYIALQRAPGQIAHPEPVEPISITGSASFSNYAQPSEPTRSSAPQSLAPTTHRLTPHIPTTSNFPGAYAVGSEGYGEFPVDHTSTASNEYPISIPFGATATEDLPAEQSHFTGYALARPPYPPIDTTPASYTHTVSLSPSITPESGSSSSKLPTQKVRPRKMTHHLQVSSSPGAAGSSDTMVLNHYDPLVVSPAVATNTTTHKRKVDEVEDFDDGKREVGSLKKAKNPNAKERKREGDRKYQQEFRQTANERREEIWRLTGITTGTLEKRHEGRTFLD